jgi:hypothetical protein
VTTPSAALRRAVRLCIKPRYPLSKKQVVEIQCERCPRKEYVASATPALPHIVITIGETTHKFEDLCTSCRKAVEGHIAEIVKKLDGRSPERKAKEPKAKEKPPVEPVAPPNGSTTPVVSPSQRRPQDSKRV